MTTMAHTFALFIRAATVSHYAWCALLAPALLAFGIALNTRLEALHWSWLEWSPFHVRANITLLPLRFRFVWLPYALVLAFAMPFFALIEEVMFRSGTTSLARGVLWGAIAFGAFHLLSLVSVRMALYLTLVGGLFVVIYALAGLVAVFVLHASYNLTALTFLLYQRHRGRDAERMERAAGGLRTGGLRARGLRAG